MVQVNTKAWRNALQRAGIVDFRWRHLRHTFAVTWHREVGIPTRELQRLGGWQTQSMVEKYAHVLILRAFSATKDMTGPMHENQTSNISLQRQTVEC